MNGGERCAARLFAGVPVTVACVYADAARDDVGALHERERALVARAAPARVRVFALGRRAAHVALAQAGAPRGPVLAGADRAPLWPAGWVGSIAHARDVALAAVARADAVLGLGVDVEERRPLEPELWARVLTGQEQAALRERPEPERGVAALRVFCAKEAVYKAWYPRGRRILEFAAVELEQLAEDEVAARVRAAPGAVARARVVMGEQHVFASAVIAAWVE